MTGKDGIHTQATALVAHGDTVDADRADLVTRHDAEATRIFAVRVGDSVETNLRPRLATILHSGSRLVASLSLFWVG